VTRPAFVRLTPGLKHPTVAWLQALVNESKYVRPSLLVDGVYGAHSAQEAKACLYRLGHPDPGTTLEPADLAALWAWSQGKGLPVAWRARRLARMAAGIRKGWGITARSWIGLHPGDNPVSGSLVVHSRQSLGLRPPARVPTVVSQSPSDGAVVHWQGLGRGGVGYEAASAQLRGFQRYHMDTHGWNDLGYHFAIPRGMPVGHVFEGRGHGVYGAHSGHSTANARLGILVMFGADDGAPTPEQYATLRLFLREHARGHLTGHKEWSGTSCPGTALYSWVKAHRSPS
jgi:hypothetical protein